MGHDWLAVEWLIRYTSMDFLFHAISCYVENGIRNRVEFWVSGGVIEKGGADDKDGLVQDHLMMRSMKVWDGT